MSKTALDSEVLFVVRIKSSANRRLQCLKSSKAIRVAVKEEPA